MPSSPSIDLKVYDPVSGESVAYSIFWMGVYDEFPVDTSSDNIGLVGVHSLEYMQKAWNLDFSKDLEEPEGDPDVYWTILNENSNNDKTGVLRIYTFSPSDSNEFINIVEDAVCNFKKNNISKLIIDVSQNGGGSICLGYAVERFLFPDISPDTGSYDIKASELFKSFATSAASQMCSNHTHQVCGLNPEVVGYFTPCAWYDWYSKSQYYDSTWFLPGKMVTRGGIPDSYSTFITQNCESEYSRWIPANTARLELPAQNIILLSDGLCGSTCAVFSRHLQLTRRVKAITTGGVYGGQQPSLTSFPGGEVVHYKYILSLAERYGVQNDTLVPKLLPTTADFRFAIREIFGVGFSFFFLL